MNKFERVLKKIDDLNSEDFMKLMYECGYTKTPCISDFFSQEDKGYEYSSEKKKSINFNGVEEDNYFNAPENQVGLVA